MSNKPIPGWLRYHARLSGSENHRGFYITDATGFSVADVMPIDPDGIEGEKLARLMCAAPDLLKALKLALKVLQGEEMTKQSLINALEASLAAIAKAEGEAV